jgi:urea transport system permease protein
MIRRFSLPLVVLLSFALALVSANARASDMGASLRELASSDKERMALAVDAIAKTGDPSALSLLEALSASELRLDEQGNAFRAAGSGLEPLSGVTTPHGKLLAPVMDNRLRRQLEPALASLKLAFPDRKVRLAAAQDLAKSRNDDLAPLVRHRLATEQDRQVKSALALALAQSDLFAPERGLRLAALATIEDAADASFAPELERLTGKRSDGTFNEPDASVRRAAGAALSAVQVRKLWLGLVGHLFYGLSLGSVLLLCALGLAITFGLMRVINMAHGELLMIGAYATYSVQRFFQLHLPAHGELYLLAAVPIAFVVTAAIGMALERTVIRYLYGRPLETLLATWGISLILIQTVRLIYGAQNVAVANPSWLAGGIELLPGFVLTYSRVGVILFASAVVFFVWFMLQRTSLGLHVRAVTQNREMAAGMGIATRRVDVWTFGIGSGVAGLGGVALSQLGNVGPELGQQYIVDSFMVVVLGGVGKLAGTLAGAFGLGVANKLLEPAAGAVLAKIVILGFIILFIQRRPQGIFALKGRAAEAM